VVLLALLFVGGSYHFFSHDAGAGYTGPRVDADGLYYWVYLRSLVVNRDVDFTNEYKRYGNPWQYGPGSTGKPGNPATIGSALLWAPLYLPVRGIVLLAARSDPTVRTDGRSRPEVLASLYGSFVCGFLALLLVLRICRRHVREGPALWATAGMALGSGLFFWTNYMPSYSHAHAAFAVGLFVDRWDATRRSRTARQWALLGALGGLAMLVRPQLVMLAALPLVDVMLRLRDLLRLRQGRAAAARRLAAGVALGAAAAVAAFVPQMLAWNSIYGRLLTVPQGENFMQWSMPLWREVLFHPRAGLLPWMPLAAAALLGLVLLARRAPAVGWPLLLVMALMTYVNGACWDWWAGYSYGARRFTFAVPLLGLGLAVALDAVWGWSQRHARAFAAATLLLVLGSFCVFNLRMMVDRRTKDASWKNNRVFYNFYLGSLRSLTESVYKKVGNPLSWPANLVFAVRYDTTPDRYDIIAGRYFLDEKHGIVHRGWPPTLYNELDLAAGWLGDFMVAGFDDVREVDRRRARRVTSNRAVMLLPLIQRPEVEMTLSGRSRVDGTRLGVRLNDRLLGRRTLGRAWQQMKFRLTPEMLRRGINELVLEHRPPAAGRAPDRRIGKTGVRSPVDLAIFSTGYSHGDRAEIWVDGERRGQNRRGLNAVSIDPRSGRVSGSRAFDLCFWENGSQIFERWVEQLPRGAIVALAVRDDASRRFRDPALKALRQLGAATTLAGKYRHGYAAVGVKGAAPGSALERLTPGDPAVVVVGRKPDSWTAVAYYDRITLHVTKEMTFEQ
jgi:hypothetical protein